MKELVHLALIMDGNGRWAQNRGLKRTKGHEEGARAAERVMRGCIKNGIKFLTLYCFSTENWKRPKEEVDFLMGLLSTQTRDNIPRFNKEGIRILLLGNRDGIPLPSLEALDEAVEKTKNNTTITVQLAINYGGRDEIKRAINNALSSGVKSFDDNTLLHFLDNPFVPEPDMIARSSGEERLSGFLLFQSSYAEFAFLDKLWPDWNEETVDEIVNIYNNRTRKFGKVLDNE